VWSNEQLQGRVQTFDELNQELLGKLNRLNEEGHQLPEGQVSWREEKARVQAVCLKMTMMLRLMDLKTSTMSMKMKPSLKTPNEASPRYTHNPPAASMYEEGDEKYYRE
jgi:hypothetical protein